MRMLRSRPWGPVALVAAIVAVVAIALGPLAPTSGPSGSGSTASPAAFASSGSPGTAGSGSSEPTAANGTSSASAGPTAAGTASPTGAPLARPTAAPTPKATPRPTPKATPKPTPKPTAKPTPKPASKPPSLAACPIFPASNVWNRRVDSLPVRSDSAVLMDSIGLTTKLHASFDSSMQYGIPFNIVGKSTPRSTVAFKYANQSDKVGYPIPSSPQIEKSSDHHIVMIDTDACRLYELHHAAQTSSGWTAVSGATWDLRSNHLRPDGWTSADAAGLPIFPGLVRYDEVARGLIAHALRFTVKQTRDAHIYPARHHSGVGNAASLPPMGLRIRLKASVDIAGFGPQARVILTALKRYGMILADQGPSLYVKGSSDTRWSNAQLRELGQLTGADFEVVNTAGFVNG